MNLKLAWNKLVSKYSKDPELINNLWNQIQTCYSTPGRYYHNLSHLEYMLEKAQLHKTGLLDQDTVILSIFYHDLVYDPQRNDNEQNSAIIAGKALASLGLPEDQILKCQNQVLATKYHDIPGDHDTNYLIDFDLAILGDSPGNYRKYSKNIRKEYYMFNDRLYKKGRSKVISHFIGKERIFNTRWFYDNYELQARENLKTELENLGE